MDRRPASRRSSIRSLALCSVNREALVTSQQIQETQKQQELRRIGGASLGFVDLCKISFLFIHRRISETISCHFPE